MMGVLCSMEGEGEMEVSSVEGVINFNGWMTKINTCTIHHFTNSQTLYKLK